MAKFERTYGAVIYREGRGGQNESRRYLILFNVKGHWDFPKGRPEPGETPEKTMRREIREEAGMAGLRFVPGFARRLKWRFRRQGKWVQKRALFRLARGQAGRIRLSAEHAKGRWVGLAQGLRLLPFSNSRALLRAADRFLSRRPAQDR